MIYDDKTLSSLSKVQLLSKEKELTEELKTYFDYWTTSNHDNESWAWKITVHVECLKQVKKHLENIKYK